MHAMRRVMMAQAAGGGGGSPLSSLWDDNFDVGSSVDTAGTRQAGAKPWILVNDAFATSQTYTGGQYRVTKTTNSSKRVCIMQAAPTGAFTAFTKVTHTLATGNGVSMGIVVADFYTPGSGNQWFCALGINTVFGASNYGIGVDYNLDYQTYFGNVTTYQEITPWGPYLRLSRNGTAYELEYSNTGSSWTSHGTWTSSTVIPNYIGLGYAHERASTTDVCTFDAWAVVDGTHHAALPGTFA